MADARSARRRFGLLPVARRVAVIVGVFVAIVTCLILVVNAEMAIMAGIRAYVEGESAWSKNQKDAVFHLQRYAVTRNARDWARYRTAIAVPLGDHRARRALARPTPDVAAARAGFLAGRNHPDDVDEMIMLYRRFGGVSYMARAITIWRAADRDLVKLAHVAELLRATMRRGGDRDPVLRRIAVLNRRLTPIEEAFSATLGSGVRALRRGLRVAIDGIALALVAIGVAISWHVLRRMQSGEERYRHLLETAGDAIFVIDASTERIVDANPRAGDLLGAPFTALVGAPIDGVMPDSVALPAPNDPHPGTVHVRRADGTLVPVEVTTSVAVLDGRRVHQRIVRDVTERTQAAAAQRAAAHALVRSLAEVERARRQSEERAFALARQAVELDAAREAALASVRAKSEFVATMSHELRTPLNVILGYVDILRDAGMGPVNDAQHDTLRRVHESALQLLELIDATLTLGRIDAERERVHMEPVDVPALLADVTTSLASLVPAGVELRTTHALGAERPLLDRVKLTTIVRNLVGNALKFTDRGSVELSARAEDAAVVLEVRDTGIGMQPEDLPAIFEMFHQCDGSSTRRYGGVGLGLHIVKRFVDLMRGTITVASEPGVGTLFTVRLPADPGAGARTSLAG